MKPDPFICIVGGGLAGLAAAVRLAEHDCQVDLFETRKRLGGRAGSYIDRATGELIDHCQHVAMGCCTNFLDFCRRTGIDQLLRRDTALHFIGPDGGRSDFRSWRWLPAPLHLAPSFLQQRHLSLADKVRIGRAMWKLLRTPATERQTEETALSWLRRQKQSDTAIERFWKIILVSALAVPLEEASLGATRKVLVDGFLANPNACDLYLPTAPLSQLYDEQVALWLRKKGVNLHLETDVSGLVFGNDRVTELTTSGGTYACDFCIVAAAWRRTGELLDQVLDDTRAALSRIDSSPITSVHLWLDREITSLPHAVLIGRLSQWLFARPAAEQRSEHYYQVVISASQELSSRDREEIVQQVIADLKAAFPQARTARLIRWQLLTDPHAVFAPCPGVDANRPAQETTISNLMLAGDWTATGWPATMEGAVRSGYLAAEAVLAKLGRPERLLVSDLPRGWLMRMLERAGAGG